MKYDLKRLIGSANIADVVKALDIPVYRTGGKNAMESSTKDRGFFVCPFHDDTNPSMYFNGGPYAHCFACGKNTNSVDLIMAVAEIPFSEASRMLWEIEGKPDWAKSGGKLRFSVPKDVGEFAGLETEFTVKEPCQNEDGDVYYKKTFAMIQDFLPDKAIKERFIASIVKNRPLFAKYWTKDGTKWEVLKDKPNATNAIRRIKERIESWGVGFSGPAFELAANMFVVSGEQFDTMSTDEFLDVYETVSIYGKETVDKAMELFTKLIGVKA